MAMSDKAILTIGDQQIELPVLVGTEGERAVDITKLRDQTGLITYDPSLGNTGVCRSAITFIDGEQGILRYRGIPIEQFTAKPNFVEAAWMLIFGRLPNRDELARFSDLLTDNELLHEGVKHQFQHIPPDAPPMAILSATLSNLACYHQTFLALEDEESLEEAAARLISKVRTIAAFSYRRSLGLPFNYPDPHLRYCANFLHMMFSLPHQQYIVTREVEDALNLIFILHGDHEQNCSTSTVRVVGSAKANLFASCAAARLRAVGPAARRGQRRSDGNARPHPPGRTLARRLHPRRQGQDQPLPPLRLRPPHLSELRSAGEDPQGGLRQGLRPDSSGRTPCWTSPANSKNWPWPIPTSSSGGCIRTWTSTAASCLRAMGIPTNMFTVCFAIGRLPGWIAQWKEQHDDPTTKILRPGKSIPARTKPTTFRSRNADPRFAPRPKNGRGRGVPSVGTQGRNAAGVWRAESDAIDPLIAADRLPSAAKRVASPLGPPPEANLP